MMTTKSNATTRLTALALLLIGLAGLATVAALPHIRLATIREQISSKSLLLTGLRKKLTEEPGLRREHKRLLSSDMKTKLLLPGTVTGVAGANLQKLLVDLVKKHGGQANSFQVLPPKQDGNLIQISMGLIIRINTPGLRDLLFALETKTPLIFVDDISITGNRFGGPRNRRVTPLSVNMKVSGFIEKRETS